MKQKNTFHLLIALSLILGMSACVDPDSDGDDIIIPVGGEMAGEMAAGTLVTAGETAGGETAGTMTAGTMTAGTMTAGTMTAGTMTAGTMTAGTMTAGAETAGTMTAGTMTAGAETAGTMTAGTEMAGTVVEMGDPCETRQVDATLPCPATIYEARNASRIALGRIVTVEGVISATRQGDSGTTHIVLQVSPSSPDYIDPAYSATWVYLNDAEIEVPALSIGMSVEVTAEIADYFGQRQLQKVTALNDLGGLYPAIIPVMVDPSAVATAGPIAEPYEAVLVRVSPVEVIEQNPIAGPGDRDPNNEFVIAGGLRVNDFLTTLTPLPEVGETWEQISGVLRFGNGDYKLEPRDASDIGRPIPMGDVSGLRINEVDYSQPGADDGEFVEIINTGSQPAPLWGVYLDMINGTNLSPYSSYHLVEAADTLAPGGILVVGSANILSQVSGPALGLSAAIQNGPDGLRLSHDEAGLLDELAYGELTLSEGTASVLDEDNPDFATSLGRCAPDSNDNSVDFVVMNSSPGIANQCQ